MIPQRGCEWLRIDRTVRLIAVDLDYTLLDSTFELPERNRRAVASALDRGIVVTLATGRMFVSALRFAEALGISAPLITYNGAYIRCAPSGRVLSHVPVERDHALTAIRLAAELGFHCCIYLDDKLYTSKNGWEAEMYSDQCGVLGIFEPDLESLLTHTAALPTKVLPHGAPDAMVEMRVRLTELVSGQAYVTQSTPYYVEMMNKQVSKGKALKTLSESLVIPRDHVMAIGDSYNDIDMIEYAGVGVAVANSPEKVKSSASLVVPSNDDAGVAVAIEACLAGVSP